MSRLDLLLRTILKGMLPVIVQPVVDGSALWAGERLGRNGGGNRIAASTLSEASQSFLANYRGVVKYNERRGHRRLQLIDTQGYYGALDGRCIAYIASVAICRCAHLGKLL